MDPKIIRTPLDEKTSMVTIAGRSAARDEVAAAAARIIREALEHARIVQQTKTVL